MPRNIEIKACVASLAELQSTVAEIAHQAPIEIMQDDTFFHCPNGRLKLRDFMNGAGQLIFYQRADQQGPKESFYVISETAAPDTLRATLTHAYGAIGRVRKRRTLFLVGQTRVHLDQVEGLGDFVELEVVLSELQTAAQGTAIAQGLMEQLGIRPGQLIQGAYLDLLCAR